MALTNLNKLFVRVTDAGLRDAVIAKSGTDNKIYFLTTTHEIITHGAAYGLSTDVQAQIANIKSILKSFDNNGHGKEDSVNAAIAAVQSALDTYKADNDAKRPLLVKTVAYNADTKAIDFTSENGTTVQSIKASDIIGNHVVRSSSYDASTNILKLKFGGASEDVDVDIDLGQMLDMNDVISGDAEHFDVSYAEKRLTIKPVTAKVDSDTVGLADAKDVKTYVDDAISGAQSALQAADQALYGTVIPADGASTISGNAANIAALTEALADPATFWEDYTA